jgi:hypothetical protein
MAITSISVVCFILLDLFGAQLLNLKDFICGCNSSSSSKNVVAEDITVSVE